MLLHDDDDVDEWIGSIGTIRRENCWKRRDSPFRPVCGKTKENWRSAAIAAMAIAEAGEVMKRRATLAISTCGLGLLMVMSYMQVRCN